MSSREGVKVVVIDTKYVETDLRSFKAVVQRFTGKDSSVSWVDQEGSFASNAKNKRVRIASDGEATETSVDNHGSGGGGCGSMLAKGMSFKDLDRLLLELPAEEIQSLWADY